MSPALEQACEHLLALHDSVLARWPQAGGAERAEELTVVARAMEAVARQADAEQCSAVERARLWRYAGAAHADAGQGGPPSGLAAAARSFQRADEILGPDADPVERMKLDFAYGRVLVRLSEGRRLNFALQARDRFASAADLASRHMPRLLPSAQQALADAERALALTAEGVGIDRRILELPVGLRAAHEADVAAGRVDPTEAVAIDAAIGDIEQIAQQHRPEMQTLLANSGRIRDLGGRIATLAGRSTPTLTEHQTRGDALRRRVAKLRADLIADNFDQAGADETKRTAQALVRRCQDADRLLGAGAGDPAALADIERRIARPLAADIRTFLRRHHLTIIRPPWGSAASPSGGTAFFSGGLAAHEWVAQACARIGIGLPRANAAGDAAAARWDAVRACDVAVFDFSTYSRTAPAGAPDIEAAASTAAVCLDLGVAMVAGVPLVVLGEQGELPFDVDATPVGSDGSDQRVVRLAEALDEAVYGVRRAGGGNSIAASRAHLERLFTASDLPTLATAMKALRSGDERDAVTMRRLMADALSWGGDRSAAIVFPAWPADYPDAARPRMFHVTPFGPKATSEVAGMAQAACEAAPGPMSYVRGDLPLDSRIVGSIWGELCRATHVLVDLTGLNPNVAIELGIARALGRQSLLIHRVDAPSSAAALHAVLERHVPALAKERMHGYRLARDGPRALRALLDRFASTPCGW